MLDPPKTCKACRNMIQIKFVHLTSKAPEMLNTQLENGDSVLVKFDAGKKYYNIIPLYVIIKKNFNI